MITKRSLFWQSDDHFRVNWCLKYMAEKAGETIFYSRRVLPWTFFVSLCSWTLPSLSKGIMNQLKLLNVEDLVVELYQHKFQKEPSKTWVCNSLDASMWDYSSNTRYSVAFSTSEKMDTKARTPHLFKKKWLKAYLWKKHLSSIPKTSSFLKWWI